jgi:hypothetical protein
LLCALGHKGCRDNRSVLYQRVPKLFTDLALARGEGRYARIMRSLTGAQLLILDHWGIEPLDGGARDLDEILEARYGRRSTILTSQTPIDKWHEVSATRPMPTPSSTASFTTPIASISPAQPATNPTESNRKRLTSSSLLAKNHLPAGRRSSGRHHVGTPGDMISE